MLYPLSCARCHSQVSNFLWLECSHHVCITCAKATFNEDRLQSQIKEQECRRYQCRECLDSTSLNQETVAYLMNNQIGKDKENQQEVIKNKVSDKSNRIKKTPLKANANNSISNVKSFKSTQINFQDLFCLNCMQQVSQDFRKFHKDHRIISSSLCLLQIQHLLQQQQTKLQRTQQKLNDQINSLKVRIDQRRQYKEDLSAQINRVFREILREMQRIKDNIQGKLDEIVWMGHEKIDEQLERKQKQKESVVWLMEDIKIALTKKQIGFVKEQFKIVKESRKVIQTNLDLSQLTYAQNNIKIELDEQLINRSINLIEESIVIDTKKQSFPLKQSHYQPTTQRLNTCQQPSLSLFSTSKNTDFKSSAKKKQPRNNDPSSFFESLKSKIFQNRTFTDRPTIQKRFQTEYQQQKLKTVTNQKQSIKSPVLREIINTNISTLSSNTNTRVSRFGGFSHHMSVKEEISKMSRELREKSESRRERQKDKENGKNGNKKMITIML